MYFKCDVKEVSSTVAMPFERSGPCSAIGSGGVSGGSCSSVMVETKIYAGVLWWEGGQELVQCGGSCRSCHGRADLVYTIVGGRDASAGWRGE